MSKVNDRGSRRMVDLVSNATVRCESCGNDLRATARFCDACGSAVAPARPVSEHKQVTVLFADVVGSMKLAATLDPERFREVMKEVFNRAAAVIQRYQGTVDKFTGDGLMAVFGAPAALEDHALRACIAALEIQSVIRPFAAEAHRHDGVSLQLRIGVNSGEVVAGKIGPGPGSYTTVGHSVGMAQRMEAAAPANGVLCSLTTARLVQDACRLGPVELVAIKNVDEPVPARRLLEIEPDRMVLGRNEGTLLGRDNELNRLRAVFDEQRGCLIGVVGDPGLGKSRLVSELIAEIDRHAEIVFARCESHTATHAFRALSRVLRALFKVVGCSDAEARERTSAQCHGLLSASADEQILFEAMRIAESDGPPLQVSVDGRRRRLVEIMTHTLSARNAPTVLVLEDAHWIDPPSDDVLAGFSRTLMSTGTEFIVTYRPEFRGALRHSTTESIILRPLADSTTTQLVGQLLGSDRSVMQLVGQIAGVAGGNPFFAEEIVRDLSGRGLLSGSRGSYRLTADVGEITVPPTVQAALAARIDRLPPQAKSALNTAAVIGDRFDVETLGVLLNEPVTGALAELVSAELIDQTEFVPERRYCFRHPLVRTVAYESQLSSSRADVHRNLAGTLAARSGPTLEDNAGQIATHLEAAGELDGAYRWYLRSADWLRLRDLPAARAKWQSAQRIADHLPDGHVDLTAMRITPRTMLTSTLMYVGYDPESDVRYRELRELTLACDDRTSLAIAMAGRIFSLAVNESRISEAASLAEELNELAHDIRCDPGTTGIVLNAVAFGRFVNCTFDQALDTVAAIERLDSMPTIEWVPALALRGGVECLNGTPTTGQQHLREARVQARSLPPVTYAATLIYSAITALVGVINTDEMVDDLCDVLRRADAFGDISGLLAAQFAYGTVLLRTDGARRQDAIQALRHAHGTSEKYGLTSFVRSAIRADLARETARAGHLDGAIEELRTLVSSGADRESLLIAGVPREALVELLIERGSTADRTEAHLVLDEWEGRRPAIPALDLWWLHTRALLARADGDSDGFAASAGDYLAECERLDARGRLAEARRLVHQAR